MPQSFLGSRRGGGKRQQQKQQQQQQQKQHHLELPSHYGSPCTLGGIGFWLLFFCAGCAGNDHDLDCGEFWGVWGACPDSRQCQALHLLLWSGVFLCFRQSFAAAEAHEQVKAGSTLRCPQAVPHPSTNRALCCLTSEVGRDPVYSTRYGRRRQFFISPHTCAFSQ